MTSFRQLLTAYGPLLLIDAASARIQVGLFASEVPARWAGSGEESGVGVFRCLDQLGVQPDEMGAFVFCDGPGSILGIRTVAMALRTWSMLKPRPIFAYHSLALVAQAIGRRETHVIADARRGTWHYLALGEPLRRVPTAELRGELLMPEGFRHWTPLPAGVASTSYQLAELLPRVMEHDLFRAVADPDAFLHEEPSYVTWTPQIHRAS